MPSELTITNLECVVTKLRLEPGYALLVKCNAHISQSSQAEIRAAFEESFGVPMIVLPPDLTLEAVLNIPPELAERARQLGSERTRRMLESLKRFVNVPTLPTEPGHDSVHSGNATGTSAVGSTEESHA